LTLIPRRFPDRRFERATLQRLLPVFALYLILLVLWPVDRPLGVWHGIFGLTDRIQDTSLQLIYPRIEHLVAFTMLGYLTAEWRGRSELPLKQDLPRLLAVIAGSVLTLELLAGFQTGSGASFIRAVMAILSALFGGSIYHLLRAHIRFLLAR
jgi:hypothetical protein